MELSLYLYCDSLGQLIIANVIYMLILFDYNFNYNPKNNRVIYLI